MRCRIQWVDENGKPTPDENEATCEVQCEEHSQQIAGRTIKFDETEWFPCCPDHAKLLSDPDMKHWRIRQLAEQV